MYQKFRSLDEIPSIAPRHALPTFTTQELLAEIDQRYKNILKQKKLKALGIAQTKKRYFESSETAGNEEHRARKQLETKIRLGKRELNKIFEERVSESEKLLKEGTKLTE